LVISLGAIITYILTRSAGLLHATKDIGSWAEPAGIPSVLMETAFVVMPVIQLGIKTRSQNFSTQLASQFSQLKASVLERGKHRVHRPFHLSRLKEGSFATDHALRLVIAHCLPGFSENVCGTAYVLSLQKFQDRVLSPRRDAEEKGLPWEAPLHIISDDRDDLRYARFMEWTHTASFF
jgi:hypothetical protein